jgi:hypothetical protein
MSAQKVTIDYDRSVEFKKFKTYTWAELGPVRMPLLRLHVIGAIDEQLAAKGLVHVDQDADLIVACVASLAGEANQGAVAPAYPGTAGPPPTIDATMWTGQTGLSAPNMSVILLDGGLIIDLIDPHVAKITWRAVGRVNLDPARKQGAVKRVDKMIAKMFTQYPPDNK